MKSIIKTFVWLMGFFAFLGITSCQELTIDSQEDFPARIDIDAQSNYEIVATSPKNIVFNISSNIPWNIESSESWCIPSPAMSSASSLVAEISVVCESNPNTEERTATLTIHGEGMETATTVTIKQNPKGILEVQPIDNEFAVAGGTATFTVTSNQAWRVVSSRQWLTFDKTEGNGTGQIEKILATCESNQSGAVRNTIVTVSNGIESKTFEVSQKGSFLEFKPIEEANLTFPAEGGTKVFEINTNLSDWDVTTSNENVAIAKKTEDGKVEVKMSFNNIFMDRTADITLAPKGTSISGLTDNVITITQGVNFDPCITGESKITVDPKTGAALLDCSTSEQCRYRTKLKNYQLGKYTWTFSDVQVTDGFWIDANFYHKKPEPHWDIYLGTPNHDASAPFSFKTWAKDVEGFDYGKYQFTVTTQEVNAMRKLELDMKPLAGDKSKITVKLTLNDKVLVNETMTNPFIKYPDPKNGTQVYFGFFGNNTHTPGKLTLTSFNVERYK